MGHPNDDILCTMLDKTVLLNNPYTSTDVRNAQQMLGRCLACVAGKFREAPAPTSMSPPAEKIGDNVHVDILPYTHTTIGGFTAALICVDEWSKYTTLIGLTRKTKAQIIAALIKLDKYYHRYGHTIKHITPDAEHCLLAATDDIGDRGIQITPTIPGRHSRRIERQVQTLRDRNHTVKASLPYVM